MNNENPTVTSEEMNQTTADTAAEVQANTTMERSFPRVAVGVAAASGTALLAVSMVGIAPVVIAGAAGYFAYCGMTGQKA